MALPLSFSNSFFTPDLRQGVQVLWAKLEAGVQENEEILRFVGDRASASSAAARALRDSAESQFRANGFAKDDGASLRRTFEGIKYETAQVAKAHENVARNLDSLIIKPFTTWSHQHEGRISELKDQLNESIQDWEDFQNEVRKLKDARSVKCGLLDEAEDDLKFAPTSPGSVNSVSSSSRPRSGSGGAAAAASLAFAQNTASQAAQAAQQASTTASNLARTLTQRMKVSPTAHALKSRLERMRLEAKERELVAGGKDPSRILEEEELVDEEGSKLDKTEKREVAAQERNVTSNKDLPNFKVDELEIAGVVKHPKDWSVIFARAKREVPTTAVKVPLIGTTPDAHSGEDLVLWFKDKLEDLGGSLSRAHELCRQLSEDLAILKLVGEIGNKFYDSSDTFYAWRPDAFALDQLQAEINDAHGDLPVAKEQDDNLTKMPEPTRERKSSPLTMSPRLDPTAMPPALPEKDGSLSKSPLSPTLGSNSNGHRHTSSSGLSRSNTLSFLSSAYENAARNVSSSYTKIAKTGFTGVGGDRLDKLQKEAEASEEAYRVALRELDETRTQTEELVHHSFNRAQKYEFERLTAIKSVFSTYTSTLASLNSPLQHSSERTILLQEAFVPSSDLNSIIERYRTGPFRPKPNVWVDWYHEATDVRFGIDLRHWRDTNDQSKKLPELIPAILGVIEEGYPKLPSDDERRKTWIYDVPLQYTHKLRNITNSSASPVRAEDIQRFDLPVLASGIKLWLLELAVSLVPQSMYSDVKAIYPSVGANVAGDDSRIASLKTLLERLPKIHLVVLDAILSHLEALLNLTKADGEEASDSEYMSKLGATFGPCIVRPQADTSKTLNDRFPALFFVDLLKHYEALLPPVLAQKNKVEEERYAPKRQRTKMVDQRLSRKAVEGQDAKGKEQLLKEEKHMRTGSTTSDAKQGQNALKITSEPEELSEKQVPQQSKEAPALSAPGEAPQQEKLEIPLPASSEGDSSTDIPESTTPGFATPPEVAEASSGQTESALSPQIPASQPMQQSVSAEGGSPSRAVDEEEDDLDKPLATTTLLSRSQTGSSAKRTAGLSAKTRGPRPMSIHGGTAGSGAAAPSNDKITSPSGSPLLGGQSGVRARAAMFEQSTKK